MKSAALMIALFTADVSIVPAVSRAGSVEGCCEVTELSFCDTLTEAQCDVIEGQFMGPGLSCGPDGFCVEPTPASTATGSVMSTATATSTFPTPTATSTQPAEGCCEFTEIGECQTLTKEQCESFDGQFMGPQLACLPPGFCQEPPPSPTPTFTRTSTRTASPTWTSTATSTHSATATGTPQPDGAACTTPAQCVSTFCEDGVCCDRSCDGLGESCSVPGHIGECTAVAPVPAASSTGLVAMLLVVCAAALFALRRMMT